MGLRHVAFMMLCTFRLSLIVSCLGSYPVSHGHLPGESALCAGASLSVCERKTGIPELEGAGCAPPVSLHTQALERWWGQGKRVDGSLHLLVKAYFLKI